MQRVRGVLAGSVIAVPLAAWLVLWLHSGLELGAVLAGIVGLAVFAVVGSRSDAHDLAADVAWRLAAADMPPASDRSAMEAAQADMPAPGKPDRDGNAAPSSAVKSGGSKVA